VIFNVVPHVRNDGDERAVAHVAEIAGRERVFAPQRCGRRHARKV
jgi:hypothetical protein